jgi:hypothetical protein
VRGDGTPTLIDLSAGVEYPVRVPVAFDDTSILLYYDNGYLGVQRMGQSFDVWSLRDNSHVTSMGVASTHTFWFIPDKAIFVSNHFGAMGSPPPPSAFAVHWTAKPGELSRVSRLGKNPAAPAVAQILRDRRELLIHQHETADRTSVQRWSLPPTQQPLKEVNLPGRYNVFTIDSNFAGATDPSGRFEGFLKLDDLSWERRFGDGQLPQPASQEAPIWAWYEKPGTLVIWSSGKSMRHEFPTNKRMVRDHRVQTNLQRTRTLLVGRDGFQLWNLENPAPSLLLEGQEDKVQFTSDYNALLIRGTTGKWRVLDQQGQSIGELNFDRDIAMADFRIDCPQLLVWTPIGELFRIPKPPSMLQMMRQMVTPGPSCD